MKTKIQKLTPRTRLMYDPELHIPETNAQLIPISFKEKGLNIKKTQTPLATFAYFLKLSQLFPMDALRKAIDMSQRDEIATPNLAAVNAVAAL